MISKLENFIIGKHLFLPHEFTLKYRFLLVGYMLLSTAVAVFVVSMVRIFMHSYVMGFIDFFVSALTFSLFFYLRNHRNAFNLVSTVSIFIVFSFFSLVLVLVQDQPIRLSWYGILIVATYLVKGRKFGFKLMITNILILIAFHLHPSIDLNVTDRDVVFAIIFYISISMFMTFSERQQSKNIESIEARNEEIAEQQKILHLQSRVSPLTKLPNKIVLQEDISDAYGKISCMLLEVDQYAMLTNEFGEIFMDKVYFKIGETLEEIREENMMLYHIHSNKFAFLISNPKFKQDILLANKIKSIFNNLKIKDEKIEVSINFLIAIVREKEWTLAHANMILYEIKKGLKSNCTIYKYDLKKEQQQKNNMYWARRLNELIVDDKLVVYYQPIIDNLTEKIVKYECLIRAIDGDKIVSPYFFLSVAKSKGMLKDITKIVIEKSFKTFAKNDFDFSINITEQDLSENYLVDYLCIKVKEYKINPNRVFLEVLENINYQDSYDSSKQFEKLRELGFRLAIDDFGAEASNLSRLLTLKSDIIKIDGQFVKNLESDADSIMIVETVVSLAQKMGVKTVAEFVHNEEVYKIVKDLGVDFSQGFYFSQPLPQVAKSDIALEKVSA